MSSGIAEGDILGVRFDLTDYETVLARIAGWKKKGERGYIAVSNPHSVMTCHKDPDAASAIAKAALTLPDGVGISFAAKLLGYANHGRITGPQLMLTLCDIGRNQGYRHYFYGDTPETLSALVAKLSVTFPGLSVAGSYSPPFRTLSREEDEEIITRINAAQPDIVWVGLGFPKQEKWMAAHRSRINATAMIGVGAAFAFHSGKVPWAPLWMRRYGLEWAHRLALEPRRMFKRNLDSFTFTAAVLGQKIRQSLSRSGTGGESTGAGAGETGTCAGALEAKQ